MREKSRKSQRIIRASSVRRTPDVLYESLFVNADGTNLSSWWSSYTPAVGMTGVSYQSDGDVFYVYATSPTVYGLREGILSTVPSAWRVSLIDVGTSSYDIESWQSTTSSYKLSPCWRSADGLDMFWLYTTTGNSVSIMKFESGSYSAVASASKTINYGSIYRYKIHVGSDNKFIVYDDTNSTAGIWPPGGEWNKLIEYQDTTAFNATSTKVGFLNYYTSTNWHDRVYNYSVKSI